MTSFRTTGDAFVANETAVLEQHRIDVAPIDGLRTNRQVVRDIENTLRYLRDDNAIVLQVIRGRACGRPAPP